MYVLDHGSFTGIRIGIAVLKGLCFEKNIEIVEMTSLENIFEIGISEENKSDDKDMKNTIFISVIYANNDQIYMGVYNGSVFGKGRKIIECAGNGEECLEELKNKVNNSKDLKLNDFKNIIIVYDEDTKQQGKEVIKGIKKLIEQKILEYNVIFKEVVVDNSGFEKRITDINSGKYILEEEDIIEEYEIMPNYLKKSQAKKLLENKMKNLK